MHSALFLAIYLLFPMLYISMHTLYPSAWFPLLSGSSGCCLAALIGETCVFELFGHVLTFCCAFAVVSVSPATLCTSVHFFNPSVPTPFGLSGACLAIPLGKSGSFVLFRGVLVCLHSVSHPFRRLARSCAYLMRLHGFQHHPSRVHHISHLQCPGMSL